MIRKIKQNISAFILIVTLIIMLFFAILILLGNYKKNEVEIFDKQQIQKLTEIENIIANHNKENVNKLRTTERFFNDKVNFNSPILKTDNDSIYIDLISNGISQKIKVSKLLLKNKQLYLNNQFLKDITYMTNTYISIWQKNNNSFIRIASSRAGVSNDNIPIKLRQASLIVKKINGGENVTLREYSNFDSELSVFVPLFIDGKIEGAVQFSIKEYIPALISSIYNNKESGFFILDKEDKKIIGNNTILKLDDDLLLKKVLTINTKNTNFKNDNHSFFVSYYSEAQFYVGFVFNNYSVLKNYYKFKQTIIIWFVFIAIIIIILFGLIYLYFDKNKKKYLKHIIEILKITSSEKSLSNLRLSSELGVIKMLDSYYTNISENLKKITKGEGGINIPSEFKGNQINNYIETISRTLQSSLEEKLKHEASEKLKSVIDKGNAEIIDLLQHVTKLEDLSFGILKSIIKFIEINQGGLFVVNEEDGSEPSFEMVASYSFGKKRYAKRIIPITEGLIGRAYFEKESIYLTEVPKNYTLIESGFGEEEPSYLLIVPLLFNNKVQAVIELGGIKEIKDYQIKFVEQVGENIASTISNLKHTKQTEELLYQTREQSKEIDEQRKTLEEKINTHRKQNRKLDKEMLQMLEIIESIKSVSYMIEYDLNRNIVDISKKTLDLIGQKKKDIIGTNHKDIIPDFNEKYEKLWENLISKRGKAQQIDELLIINGKEFNFEQNYVPIKNARRKIFRVLSIGVYKKNDK